MTNGPDHLLRQARQTRRLCWVATTAFFLACVLIFFSPRELGWRLGRVGDEVHASWYGKPSRSTIDRALASIGWDNGKTLVLEAGCWVLDRDADWSSHGNVKFRIDPGAILKHGTHSVSVPNRLAGRFQWLVGTGPVTLTGTVGSIFPEEFGAIAGGNPTNNTAAFDRLVRCAGRSGHTIFIPEGTYEIDTNFPLRQEEVTKLRDYRGLVVTGMGSKSILRTVPRNDAGADVFQLNGVRNVTIEKLGLQSRISGEGIEGSNGISITNGGENITIRNVHIYRLPFEESAGSTDGGAAITIQQGGIGTLPYRQISIINNTADGGSYGFSYIGSGTGVLASPPADILVSGNTFSGFYRGINIELSATGATTARLPGMSLTVARNRVVECQQGLLVNGSTGVHVISNHVSLGHGRSGMHFRADRRRFGVYLLSSFDCTLIDNNVHAPDAEWVMLVGGGWAGEPNTPSESLVVAGNSFAGGADPSIATSRNPSYGHVIKSVFTRNRFLGQVAIHYDPVLKASDNRNYFAP